MFANSAISEFGFKDYKDFQASNGKQKQTAHCKFCTTQITEPTGVTSGFTRHMKNVNKCNEHILNA